MSLLVNPRVDFAFKKLFGSEDNKDLLISLINSIVTEKDKITEVQLLNPYNQKSRLLDKESILDIKATDSQGKQYNIEMQISNVAFYNKRTLYYWGKLYTEQLQTGYDFDELKKTISINILNFNCFSKPKYHHIFRLLDIDLDSPEPYCDAIEFHFIELNKCDDNLTHIKTTLDRWANFLRKANSYNKKTFPQELKKDPAIAKAFDQLNLMSLTDTELEFYESHLKWLRDEAGAFRKSHDEGLQEGLAKGREEGKLEIAKKMLIQGLTVDQVIAFTDLPRSAIQQLQSQIILHNEA